MKIVGSQQVENLTTFADKRGRLSLPVTFQLAEGRDDPARSSVSALRESLCSR